MEKGRRERDGQTNDKRVRGSGRRERHLYPSKKPLRLDITKYLLLKVVSTYSPPLKERTQDNGVKCVAGIIFRSPPNLGWLIS